MKYLANTGGQDLVSHLIAVSKISGIIYEKIFNGNGKHDCELAGLLHDIGKVDDDFQEWVSKKAGLSASHHNETSEKKFENIIRHNELSWAITETIIKDAPEQVKYAVLWHHAEKFRKDPIVRLDRISKDDSFNDNVRKCRKLIEHLGKANLLCNEKSSNVCLPSFKNIGKISGLYTCNYQENTTNTITRLCVVVADRMVSSQTKEKLEEIVKNETYETLLDDNIVSDKNLCDSICEMLEKFNTSGDVDRNKEQEKIAKQCYDISNDVVILQGPAGVGKTKVSLEWAKNVNAKRIIYVCPRVSICLGLYNDIISEYLPNTKIQIFTGDYKEESNRGVKKEVNDNEFLNADVVITTIDQIISMITNHNKFGAIKRFIESAVIFDEFHEVINTPAIAVYLKEVLNIRKIAKSSNTMLMSATPNPLLLGFLLDKQYDKYVVKMKSFHDKPFTINLIDDDSNNFMDHPLSKMKFVDDSFIISNNISVAQVGFLKHIDDEKYKTLVVHSSYSKCHREKLFDKMFKSFGIKGDKSIQCIRSGPVIQASLNISAKKIYTDVSSPEDILQRLGRCNRFGKDESGDFYIYNCSENKNVKTFLSKNYCGRSSSLFFKYLKDKHDIRFSIRIDDLYNNYYEFYASHMNACKKDIDKFEQDAYKQLYKNDFYRPLDFFIKHKKIDNKLANKSIRGSSVYVIPTLSIIKDNQTFEQKQWLYDPKDIKDSDNFLCMSSDDYKMIDIINEFRRVAKHKNYLYGSKNHYTKHNTKNSHFIIKSAKIPQFGIFIGDLPGCKSEELGNNEYNFTYIFNENFKGDVISIGLINKNILNKILKEDVQ